MPLRPTPFLAPLGVVYGALTRARLALYRSGALAMHKIEAPVISVGNITAGGTGKTPLVEWLARRAAREGRRVCVLTRGYGRADAGERVLVSDGEQLLADARAGGDEPRLLAESLLGERVAILSDADRVAAARWAIENLGSELFILDDGFQHLRIARDLNIVTLDATDPWGGGRLLPHGHLREPLRELRRADLIVVTRADLARDLDELKDEAERLSEERAVVLTSRLRTSRVRTLSSSNDTSAEQSGDLAQGSNLSAQSFAAFCAVGNPQSFFTHLRRDGHVLSYTRAFPDHHPYTQTDVDALTREAVRSGASALLTTAKDAVKLRSMHFALPCYVVEVALEFDDEEKLVRMMREAIARGSFDRK
jgi:tetraacyldisaccharide 4'-kinase